MLDDLERGRLRNQALEWVRADLDLWDKRVAGGQAPDRKAAQDQLRQWQANPTLAGIRYKDALEKLPDDERPTWEKLWADVEALLKKIGDAK